MLDLRHSRLYSVFVLESMSYRTLVKTSVLRHCISDSFSQEAVMCYYSNSHLRLPHHSFSGGELKEYAF